MMRNWPVVRDQCSGVGIKSLTGRPQGTIVTRTGTKQCSHKAQCHTSAMTQSW